MLQGKAKQIVNFERRVSILQSEVGTLRNSMKNLSLKIPQEYPPVGLVRCMITNFIRSLTLTLTGDSDGFYTHPGGYKVCLKVCANGTGKGKGIHVSDNVYLQH